MKLTKNRKKALEKLEAEKVYNLGEACELIKAVNNTKFNSSIDIHVNLGLDPKKADQALRGTAALPHGTGKEKTVLVFCTPEFEDAAKEAGADYAGLDEFIDKVSGGWTDIDVVIASPNVMPKIARLGRVLGPRGLMPNPKVGTVTNDIGKAVQEVKKGKVSFRVDKYGIIHSSIGRSNFSAQQIEDNTRELVTTLSKMKPASAKGIYFKSIHMATTMSPSISIDPKSIV